ncbi:hypothetical protein KMW28_12885 [Flammeovirga yaeyamensis]|uniref:Restriction endonuclease n=1 Tax=Flammeovirga yaeyamensis TaxID=367791 RepID=A0AAX1N394_9BACT|nr:hypothetical protein [Flammeovirga yaeyamensis]MBB3695935.1 hypothetical protein [Flammeovirga yaeyamensis]NMF34623.1 hypothetical protein [Flammeovirga yaeyamensis]QWG00547.1 hypothetical protein KMW28_12885 [Flammeovirga yaeyamensis]
MKNLLHLFTSSINSISTKSSIPFINPTEIYNEGWMTRFLVHYSMQENLNIEGLIDFGKIKNATSEGLISSPFINAEKNREGYTHADMALGDFKIDYETRGEIRVEEEASIFGIIEAKMKSNLSKGTTNASNYNQASRNIACIVHNCIDLETNNFFIVTAPKSMAIHHKIKDKLDKEVIKSQIRNRFQISEVKEDTILLDRVDRCNIGILTYEDWIDQFEEGDLKEELNGFYDECLKWNRL